MKQIPITTIALVFTAVLPLQAAPLSAANDSKAVFENHTFNLPDVGEKDSYTIFIEVEGEKDTRRLPLPAGVSGFRLNPKAVPTAAWTWSYKIQREKPAEIRPITDDKVTIDRQDLIDGNYLLAWTPISGAKTYKVSGTSRLNH